MYPCARARQMWHFISQYFSYPEYWSGLRNRTHELLLYSQALYRLTLSCRGNALKEELIKYMKKN